MRNQPATSEPGHTTEASASPEHVEIRCDNVIDTPPRIAAETANCRPATDHWEDYENDGDIRSAVDSQSSSDDEDEESEEIPTAEVPYPGFEKVVFRCLPQTHRLRLFCLYLITSPYPFNTSQHYCHIERSSAAI